MPNHVEDPAARARVRYAARSRRSPARRGTQAARRPSGRVAPRPARDRRRDARARVAADAAARLEPAQPARVRSRGARARGHDGAGGVPGRPLLGRGQPRAPPRGGGRSARALGRRAGPLRPAREGAQPDDGPPREGARGPVPRAGAPDPGGGSARARLRPPEPPEPPRPRGRAGPGRPRRPVLLRGDAGGLGGSARPEPRVTSPPRSWLLSTGWRRAGPLDLPRAIARRARDVTAASGDPRAAAPGTRRAPAARRR